MTAGSTSRSSTTMMTEARASADHFAGAGAAAGAAGALPLGTLIRMLHALQRTIFPRAAAGTARIERQRRFGQIILTVAVAGEGIVGSGRWLKCGAGGVKPVGALLIGSATPRLCLGIHLRCPFVRVRQVALMGEGLPRLRGHPA